MTTLSSNRISPALVMKLGLGSALLSGFLAYLMIPSEAPIQETDAVGYIQPR